MNKNLLFVLAISTVLILLACNDKAHYPTVEASVSSDTQPSLRDKQFDDYWYNGTGEISSYELKQERYGQVRQGDIVLVFVTEPFSHKKQVKLDRPQNAGSDNVLSLIHI